MPTASESGAHLWDRWLTLARHPVFSTIANALGVFAGLLGGLYTKAIASAFPFIWSDFAGLSWHALFFWVFFLVFAFTFLSREWAVQRLQMESETRLQETIRTMPPRGFILEFAGYYRQCHIATRALEVIPSPNREQIQSVIRVILWTMANLARKFDARENAKYAANIMLHYESIDVWSARNKDCRKPEIKFVEPEIDLSKLPILVLEKELSASTAEKEGKPDPELAGLPELALPVPVQQRGRSNDGKRWRALPGAPLTYFSQESNTYRDVAELGEWCNKHGDFSESICGEVEKYFGSEQARKLIRSFASIPITSADGHQKLGVLNIHSNHPNLLGNESAPSQFYPLTQPLTAQLADLLVQLLKLSS